MRAASVKQMAQWGTAVLLFLLVCHGAPGTANAGCNHRLTSNPARTADWNDLDPLILGDSSPKLSDVARQRRVSQIADTIPEALLGRELLQAGSCSELNGGAEFGRI